jgi:hypothetical protein
MFNKSYLFILLAFIALSCKPRLENIIINVPANWIQYNTRDYTIHYPPNWILDTTNPKAAMLFCPIEFADSNFQTNYNIIIQDSIQPSLTLNSIITSIKNELEKNIKLDTFTYKIKEDEAILTYHGKIENIQLAWQQHLFFRNNKLYTITLTSSLFKMGYFMPIHDSIIANLKIGINSKK